MKKITELTNESKQKYSAIQENGEEFILELEFKPTQESWYFNVSKNEFTTKGQRLVLGPNILRRYSNLINFGILCRAIDLIEPMDINDLVSGRIELYILNNDELEEVELAFYQ